jgi:hypothetical protein
MYLYFSDVTVYVIFPIAFHASFMLSLISERLVMKSLLFWDVARCILVILSYHYLLYIFYTIVITFGLSSL